MLRAIGGWLLVRDLLQDYWAAKRLAQRKALENQMHLPPREWHPDDLAIYNGTDPQKPFLGEQFAMKNLQGMHFHVHKLRTREGVRKNIDTFRFFVASADALSKCLSLSITPILFQLRIS